MIFRVKKDNEISLYDLLPSVIEENEQWRKWELRNGSFAFRVKEYPIGEIDEIFDLPANVSVADLEDANERLFEIFDNYKDQKRQGTDFEVENSPSNYPYDPKKISISNFNWSVDTIRQMLERKIIRLSPDFQRNFVWDYKRQSRLIESILLGIPVPAFYLAKSEKGSYNVVDGLQRLTTINRFLNNEFNLKYLEYLNGDNGTDKLEGYYYKTVGDKKGIDSLLDGDYEFRLKSTQFNVNVMDVATPIRVKLDVFRRINSGGKPLNNQEMRNCLMEEDTRKLINELAESDIFIAATGKSVTTDRMVAQELVMRFIGFWYIEILKYTIKDDKGADKPMDYNGDMQGFLDNLVGFLNKEGSKQHKNIREYFTRSMTNAHHLFGKYCFRKCLSKHLELNAPKQLINKSLFTTWSIMLSKYDASTVIKNNEAESFARILADELENNQDLLDNVSYRTNDKKILDEAFLETLEIIKNHIKL